MSNFISHPEQPLPYDFQPYQRYQAPASAPEGLLKAVVALLGLVALTDLFAVFADLKVANLIGGDANFVTASAEDLDAADNLSGLAGGFQFTAFVACAVVFLVWFFRMRKYIGFLAQDAFVQGPGWAIGAWFIPVAALWMPVRIAIQMWNAPTRTLNSEPARYPSPWPVGLWWSLFVMSTIAGRLTSRWYADAESLTEIRDAVTKIAVTDGLDALAAVAAAYFAVRLSALHRRPAPESGPQAPVQPGFLAS
ncbi:DUF4328 domain-containing protein [Streptomyces sp. NPDC002690]